MWMKSGLWVVGDTPKKIVFWRSVSADIVIFDLPWWWFNTSMETESKQIVILGRNMSFLSGFESYLDSKMTKGINEYIYFSLRQVEETLRTCIHKHCVSSGIPLSQLSFRTQTAQCDFHDSLFIHLSAESESSALSWLYPAQFHMSQMLFQIDLVFISKHIICIFICLMWMFVMTSHCYQASNKSSLLWVRSPPFLAPSYLCEHSRLWCAGTPRRSAGSRRGREGSARGWCWSPGPRWPGCARLPGPGRWWGSPRWPELLRSLRRHRSAWSLTRGGLDGVYGQRDKKSRVSTDWWSQGVNKGHVVGPHGTTPSHLTRDETSTVELFIWNQF